MNKDGYLDLVSGRYFYLNTLILKNYDEVFTEVFEKGTKYRNSAKGYGLGSGSSIPGLHPR